MGSTKIIGTPAGKNGARPRRVVAAIMSVSLSAATAALFVLMLLRYPGMNIAFFISLFATTLYFVHLSLRALKLGGKRPKLASALQKCFFVCIAAGIIVFAALQGLIISGSGGEEASGAECIIVLGAGIVGESPSRVLASRLDAAVEYIKLHGDIPVVVSGGRGPDELISEAEAMYRYLRSRGVSEELIWKEDASTTTRENLAFSLELLKEKGLGADGVTAAVVTNEFHLYRAKHIARKFGMNVIGVPAKTPYPSLLVLYRFRESAAIVMEFIFGRGA